MKQNIMPVRVAVAVLVAAMAPICLCAQNEAAGNHRLPPRYQLVDVGTFGGPTARASGDFIGALILNDAGVATGDADTSTLDPNCGNVDCFISHVFRWRNGKLIDLGALPGANTSSTATEINAQGQIVGASSTGDIDPLTGLPESRAVLWTDGKILNLGSLGGGTSAATGIDNRGLVVGFSANTVPDPFSMFGLGTQTRTFVWENGVMRDIGTLGGPDAAPFAGPKHGRVIGYSYTNSNQNADNGPFCAPNVPTQDPFLWEKGEMMDLGTFGGTCGFAKFINSWGQITGQSALAGNRVSHPFLWDRGVLRDLGTLGGDNGDVSWMNDAGQIVGEADLPGSQTHDAFLWERGKMTDLGNLGQTSFAFAINNRGQVVGHSLTNDGTFHAFLWEKGGPMIDLNVFVPSEGSSIALLTDAFNVNDRGEIIGIGFPPGIPPGEVGSHVFLLIPCGHESENCRAARQIAVTAAGAASATNIRPSLRNAREKRPATTIERMLNRLRGK